MNSIYLKYFFSRYYTLLFDTSSSNLCIYCEFFIKKHCFFNDFCDFWPGGGVPLGKRFKKGYQNGKPLPCPKTGDFLQREAFGPLAKNMKFEDAPKTVQRQHLDAQRGPRMSKGCILEVFWIPFGGPVPTVKTVFPPRREAHFWGSGVSQNSLFFVIFWSWAKRAPPGITFGGLFQFWTDSWGFLGPPWVPIQIPGCSSSCSKSLQQKSWFFEGAAAGGVSHRLGSNRNC